MQEELNKSNLEIFGTTLKEIKLGFKLKNSEGNGILRKIRSVLSEQGYLVEEGEIKKEKESKEDAVSKLLMELSKAWEKHSELKRGITRDFGKTEKILKKQIKFVKLMNSKKNLKEQNGTGEISNHNSSIIKKEEAAITKLLTELSKSFQSFIELQDNIVDAYNRLKELQKN